MSRFAVMPNFKFMDARGATLVNAVETSFPAITNTTKAATRLVRPEKVFVQALISNTEAIYLGPTGVLVAGTKVVYEIPAGSSLYLPSHVYENWRMICASGGQYAYITYFAGVY